MKNMKNLIYNLIIYINISTRFNTIIFKYTMPLGIKNLTFQIFKIIKIFDSNIFIKIYWLLHFKYF